MARKLALVFAVLAGPAAAFAATQTTAHTVAVANNGALGKKVLVTPTTGRTLYSLSVEKKGKWVCVKQCLGFWLPVVIAKGKKPTGATGLGTIKRPDGRMQVTFKGSPLYRFSGDKARGQANGEGLKDVGVWHAAVVGPGTKTPVATTTTPTDTTTTTGSTTTTGGGGGYRPPS
jgi:predicted lipoprotein with Yx(FWY)xxD motif